MTNDKNMDAIVADLKKALPQNRTELRKSPVAFYTAFEALHDFRVALENNSAELSSESVRAASKCIDAILKFKLAGNTDKREAVQNYIRLVRYRPEELSVDSLKIVFKTIEKETWVGDNSQKWLGVSFDLASALQKLRSSITKTGCAPTGAPIEKFPNLGGIAYLSLAHEIPLKVDNRLEDRSVREFNDLLRQNNSQIRPGDIQNLSQALAASTDYAIKMSFLYPNREAETRKLCEEFLDALSGSKWKNLLSRPNTAAANLIAQTPAPTQSRLTILAT